MLIGVDLDEVLAEFVTFFLYYYNDYYGIERTREDFHSYHIEETLDISKEEHHRMLDEFYMTTYFRAIQPVKGSQKSIEAISEGNELVVITSRPSNTRNETLDWLNIYFPSRFSNIYFTDDYPEKPKKAQRKSNICRDLGIDLLIEDSLEYARACVSPNTRVLLLDCPWNQLEELPEGITRVNSWKEIVELVNSE